MDVYSPAPSLHTAQLASIGVRPGSPQSRQARVLSALHVDFSEIEMGPSLDRGAFGEVFRGYWKGNDIAVKVIYVPIIVSLVTIS